MQRRPAPLGRFQLGIVALALAAAMRCPVMPPGTMRRITAMSRHRDHLPGLASSLHFYGMPEAPAIPLRDRGPLAWPRVACNQDMPHVTQIAPEPRDDAVPVNTPDRAGISGPA
jgi:hypothetical protein